MVAEVIITVWCQVMTANGAETLPFEAVLTGEYYCDTVTCSEGIRIREQGDTQFRLMPESMCFYSNPNQKE